ncbi:hypothetical protein Pcinc_041889 [Petrolisthes cinctipes]|uniref:Uncharacterized protein n=1 Tax=Petrolisthes cinctipes TaxID=88211 RepID=A0AAE1BJC6_PETCI|nr:hypothetical protein Pcinc_041889 [Petrolisthes cinctipes]
MGISIAGGLVTGLVLRLPIFNLLKTDELYDDSKYWILEEGEGEDEEGRGGSVSLPMAGQWDLKVKQNVSLFSGKVWN